MRYFVQSFVAIAALSAWATPASSQVISVDTAMDLSMGAGSFLLSNMVLESVIESSEEDGKDKPKAQPKKQGQNKLHGPSVNQSNASATRFIRKSGYSKSVEAMAGLYPPSQQKDARAAFNQLLTAYPQIIKQLGAPENDLAVGMASFIAGNYSGYTNQPFPDDKFLPLVEQLRSSMSDDPNITAMSNDQKQQLNDILAAVGTLMAVAQLNLQHAPNDLLAKQMRQASQRNLSQTLGINAADLRFTDAGMII